MLMSINDALKRTEKCAFTASEPIDHGVRMAHIKAYNTLTYIMHIAMHSTDGNKRSLT